MTIKILSKFGTICQKRIGITLIALLAIGAIIGMLMPLLYSGLCELGEVIPKMW